MSSASSQNTYVVVARSASGAYFAPDEALVFDRLQTQHGLARVVFSTRRAPLAGFTKAVPRGLAVDIRGPAPSVDAAIDPFVQAANFFCPIISLSCNAPIEDLQPELAFDVTPGAKHRPYFQQFLLDDRIMPIRRRRVPAELTFALATAVAKHSGSDRLHRAAVHYYQALQFWRPGYETSALAHLYMGVETLTPIVREAYLASNGLSVDDLGKRWAIPESERGVDHQVRRHLIFDNDDTTYREAKGASDGLEHGFMGFPDIHAKAVAVNRKTAGYLRRAILGHVGLAPDQLNVLLGAPYGEPFYLHYTKYIWGELVGEGDQLGASDQEYPMLQWRSTIRELPTAPDETPRIQLVESYAERLADGIRFVPSRIEIRAPSGTSPESDVIAPKIEHHQSGKPALGVAGVEWNRPEMQPFADALARFLLNFGTIDFYSRLWLHALSQGEESGDELSFDSRLERLLGRVRSTEALESLRNRIEEAWLPTRRLAAMQDSIARSPLLFGWKGPDGDREPDLAVMRRRSSPHWPGTPEPVILLAELSQATEEAGAIATRIISLSAEIQDRLAAVASPKEEPETGQAAEAGPR